MIVVMPPFERTTCSCAACVECCTSQPGSLVPGDLERIAAHLGQPLRVVLTKFAASPGALVGNSRTGETWRIGTIVPKTKGGRCVFLDRENRCTIHAVAPAGCALFDTHMSAAEAQPRSQWLVREQAGADYQSLRRTLDPATTYHPRSY